MNVLHGNTASRLQKHICTLPLCQPSLGRANNAGLLLLMLSRPHTLLLSPLHRRNILSTEECFFCKS